LPPHVYTLVVAGAGTLDGEDYGEGCDLLLLQDGLVTKVVVGILSKFLGSV
jgi:hypothetical protein